MSAARDLLELVERAGGRILAEAGELVLRDVPERLMPAVRELVARDRAGIVEALTPPAWAGPSCWPCLAGDRIAWRLSERVPFSPLGDVPEDGPCDVCGRDTRGMLTRPDRTWIWLCSACADAMTPEQAQKAVRSEMAARRAAA